MTNDIHALRFDSILLDLKVANSKDILKKLSEHTALLIGTSQKILLETLLKQEEEQSSGIGVGVAIAHKQLPRLTKPFIIFAKLENPIEFNAVDGDPVDLVCLVLSPEFEGSKHLSRLSKVSRFFNDKNFCDDLRQAKDADDIRLTLKEVNGRKIAA